MELARRRSERRKHTGGASEGHSAPSNPEEGGLSYPVRGIDIGEGVLKQQRDLLGRLGLVQKGAALLVYQQVRVGSAGDECRPQLGRLCVRFERRLANLGLRGQ